MSQKAAPRPSTDHSNRDSLATTRNSAAALSNKINQILADAFVLYLKTKNFHWHVSGPHFRDYHLMLDEHAGEVLSTVDPLAERVRALGGSTLRSLGQVVNLRTLKDNEHENVDASSMLRELMEDTSTMIASMHQAHSLCDDMDDVATASLLEGYIDAAEKRSWFLRETVGPR